MKFLPILLAAPAVMGRVCSSKRPNKSASQSVAAPSSSAVVASIVPVESAAPVVNVGQSVQESNSAADAVESVVTSSATAVVVSSTSAAAPTTLATSAAAAVASSSASSSVQSTSSSTSSSDSISGSSTFYGGNLNGGACSFTTYTLPSDILGTAFSGAAWDNAAHCGQCLEVTGPSGTPVTVMIVDECPECDEGHLDLFPDAFTAVGGTDGVVDTSYTFIDCPITSPLVLHNKEGTSAYWFSMQVVNANQAIESLEVSTDGGSTWQTTTRTEYNFFENSSGFGTETVDVKVTSTSGNTVTVKDVSIEANSQATASANF